MLPLRFAKASYSLLHPSCWMALLRGVAPAIEHLGMLRTLKVDAVLDVGANRGQFSLACRQVLPALPIVAFEPIPGEARTFRKVHGRDTGITLIETALGENAGEAMLHLSRSADSSSLLPIGSEQVRLFPDTVSAGSCTVPVKRLDDLTAHWAGRNQLLLKLDVQGFELAVLKGGVQTLRSCTYVYVECSEIALYEGQALRAEVQAFLEGQRFRLAGRFNPSLAEGRLVQADYLFSR
jgi:FkbM family methyltransferase